MMSRTFTFQVAAAPGVTRPAWVDSIGSYEQWVAISSGTNTGALDELASGNRNTVMAFSGDSRAAVYSTTGLPLATSGVSGVSSYSGFGFDPYTATVYSVAGGGHADYVGNGAYALRLTDAIPKWSILRDTVRGFTYNSSLGGDITDAEQWGIEASYLKNDALGVASCPASRHLYNRIWYVPALNRVMLFGGWALAGSGNGHTRNIDGFNLATNQYDGKGAWPAMAAHVGSSYANFCMAYGPDANGNMVGDQSVYARAETSLTDPSIYRWTPASQVFTAVATSGLRTRNTHGWCYDTKRNRIFQPKTSNGDTAFIIDLNPATPVASAVTHNVGALATDAQAMSCYDPVRDLYYTVYGPTTGTGSRQMVATNPVTFSAAAIGPSFSGNSVYSGRLGYSYHLGGVVCFVGSTLPFLYMRTN